MSGETGRKLTPCIEFQGKPTYPCWRCGCPKEWHSPAAPGRETTPAEEWIKALNAASCCGTPDPNAKTLREWEAEAAARRYPPLPLRTRIGIRFAEAISCPACFRLRLSPGHLLFCGGSA